MNREIGQAARKRISTYNAVETAIERTKTNSRETWASLVKRRNTSNLDLETDECVDGNNDAGPSPSEHEAET